MPIPFECAACGATTRVADDLADRRIVCRHCKAPGRVPVPARLLPSVPWLLCLVAVLFIALGHCAARVESAAQQAAVSAEGCFWVLTAYVLAKAAVGMKERSPRRARAPGSGPA